MTNRELLEAFVIDNDDLERLEDLISEFNLFEAVGAVRQELRHSDTLRFLLDPSAAHGFGAAFLGEFLKRALADQGLERFGPVEVDAADLSRTVVSREWKNIDLLLRNDPARFVVAIENKVGSGEHSNQLQRYREIVEAECPRHRRALLFLTPDGVAPSDEAWIPVSYDVVEACVQRVLARWESRIGPDVATLLRHYDTLLRRHIVSESDIARLCRRIYAKHQQALDLIFEHRPDAHSRVVDAVRDILLASSADGVRTGHLAKSQLHFWLAEWEGQAWQATGGRWQSVEGRLLRFEFRVYTNRCVMALIIGPGDPGAREAVYAAFAQAEPALGGMGDTLSPSFTSVFRGEWMRLDEVDGLDDDAVRAIVSDHWSEFTTRELPRIRAVVRGVRWGGG
jgi:hypothetical protein